MAIDTDKKTDDLEVPDISQAQDLPKETTSKEKKPIIPKRLEWELKDGENSYWRFSDKEPPVLPGGEKL